MTQGRPEVAPRVCMRAGLPLRRSNRRDFMRPLVCLDCQSATCNLSVAISYATLPHATFGTSLRTHAYVSWNGWWMVQKKRLGNRRTPTTSPVGYRRRG